MAEDRKFKQNLTDAEAAGLLRDLADAMEGRSVRAGGFWGEIDGISYRKLEVSLKRVAAGQVAAKVKVKAEGPEAGDDGEESKDQYKKLKKRMKETYKKISETLDAGGLPDARTVRLFLTDSDEMIEWPDRGDEYYEPYRKACLLFREAFDAEDLEGCRTARGELEQVKKDCHAEYK